MSLSLRAESFVEELGAVDWFARVGQPPGDFSPLLPRWSPARTWTDAHHVMKNRTTDEFLIETHNHLSRERDAGLKGSATPRMLAMLDDQFVYAARPSITSITAVACASGRMPPEVAETYAPILSWILMHAAIVEQYDVHVRDNRLYLGLADVLRQGHCVCGWKGRFPDGELILY